MKTRKIIYISLISICVICFLSWRLGILPTELQKFIGNYGLHGMGTFASILAYAMAISNTSANYDKLLIKVSLIGLFVANFNEVLQILIPSRVFDWYDILAQTLGIVFGYLLCKYYPPFKKLS